LTAVLEGLFGGNETSKNGGNETATQVTKGVKKVKGSGSGNGGGLVGFSPAAAADIFILSSFFVFCPRKNAKKGSTPRSCSFRQQKQLFIIFICITRIVVSLFVSSYLYKPGLCLQQFFWGQFRPKQGAVIYVISYFKHCLIFWGICGYYCLLMRGQLTFFYF